MISQGDWNIDYDVLETFHCSVTMPDVLQHLFLEFSKPQLRNWRYRHFCKSPFLEYLEKNFKKNCWCLPKKIIGVSKKIVNTQHWGLLLGAQSAICDVIVTTGKCRQKWVAVWFNYENSQSGNTVQIVSL